LLVEALEQLIDQPVTRQLLAEQPECLGIEDSVFWRELEEAQT
jgi:hypothetical protein